MDGQVFHCQSCRARLNIMGLDSLMHEAGAQGSSTGSGAGSNSASALYGRQSAMLPAGSMMGSRIDESFVVLDGRAQQGQEAQHPGAGQRSLDESFVMLQGSASLARGGPSGLQASLLGIPLQGFDDMFAAMARTFELASTETKVDQPMCMECAGKVKEEVEAAVKEVQREVHAYQAALARLQAEAEEAVEEADFRRQLATLEAQERSECERAEQLEAEVSQAERGLALLQGEAAEISGLEERYWRDFNEFQLQLRAHTEERDATLSKIERAARQLERLKGTNVYDDVFHIWYDGPFGTISGFRLGKTGDSSVEWEEINAAWGQAVLLLHTMAQACNVSFAQHRLLPMGSYPRISDRKGTYDLYGPVNRLLCSSYDRAMVCFLACLREFAEHAHRKDMTEGKREAFDLPYAIDGDKVGGMTIKLWMNKDAKWTKALKYMLTDLKWCLKWMIGDHEGSAAAAQPSAPATPRSMSSSMF